jgi:uncharacterized membrane protein
VYELLVLVIISVFLECGMGIVYGIAIGYDPLFVFPFTIIVNFLTIIAIIFLVDKLLEWKKGLRAWLERRFSRGQKIIDKYGCFGIVIGICVLSPIQLAILGRLLGIETKKLYPALLSAVFLVAIAFLCVALGVFKVLL